MEMNNWRARKRLSTDEPNDCLNHNGNGLSQRLHELESKNEELEKRMNSMQMEFQTQIQHLQQQYEQVFPELKFRKNHTGTEQINNSDSNIDRLIENFKERCDLVETNNQTVIERVDSCEQKFCKMRSKTENVEQQITILQQRLHNFEMNDTNMQTIRTNDAAESTVENEIHTTGTIHDMNDSFDLIEKALCHSHEKEIKLLTDEIQYGTYGICDKYKVILMKEKDKLKLFDYHGQIDERPWGETQHKNYATCIHWCEFLDKFLILYRFRLCVLPLKQDPKTFEMSFGELEHIESIRTYSLKSSVDKRRSNAFEILRFITTSRKLPGYMYLNRGYRRLELVNTNSWKVQRGWSKQDLDYGDFDSMKSITLSDDGSYLAMNIDWNERVKFVDLRKHDDQLSLLKRIRMPKDAVSLSHKAQILFGSDAWFLVDEKNQCYITSANPSDERITLIRTDHIHAIENIQIRLGFVRNNSYLFVGAVIGNHQQKQGVFRFYKIPT